MKKLKYNNNITIFTADDYAVIEFNTMLTASEKTELRRQIKESNSAINFIYFRQYKIDRWKTKKH